MYSCSVMYTGIVYYLETFIKHHVSGLKTDSKVLAI